ncbi:MAG: ABC transporter substrate-binding protein [Treponema sp.]|jgi:iron complex transport system substrate-binding protein|nr:ABC transporter substrate-binding protein [Treponema sp.]
MKTLKTVLAFAALLFAACAKGETGRLITDPMGGEARLFALDRIISTAPSNTEIIIGLGLGERLVAVDKYSAGVTGVDPNLPRIDFVYPDAEAIIALAPDLIIAAEHNRVTGGDDPFTLIREAGIAVVYLPTSEGIDGIYRGIAFIAGVLEADERGEAMIAAMRERIAAYRAAAEGREKKRVYFEISPPPHIVSFGRGTFLDELIEITGAENIFSDTDGWIAPGEEAVASRNPQVILTNVPYPQSGSAFLTEEFRGRPGFDAIDAVKAGRVFFIDTDASSRPSQHILAALEQIVRAVYPGEDE